jgi:hypothetical protein
MNGMTTKPLFRLAVALAAVALLPAAAAAEEETASPGAPSPSAPPAAERATPPPPPAVPPAVFVPAPNYAAPAPVPLFGDRQYRSPGLAVALSLQPLPIDFGNLYAENVGWGIAYSAVEVSLLAPMMWMTGQHMNHGSSDNRGWSGMETGAMMGLGSTYVVVKLVSGLHASYAARRFNREWGGSSVAAVLPISGGAMLAWTGRL